MGKIIDLIAMTIPISERALDAQRELKPGETIGIVFAGGGFKGAYQIGAWKALLELGISRFE